MEADPAVASIPRRTPSNSWNLPRLRTGDNERNSEPSSHWQVGTRDGRREEARVRDYCSHHLHLRTVAITSEWSVLDIATSRGAFYVDLRPCGRISFLAFVASGLMSRNDRQRRTTSSTVAQCEPHAPKTVSAFSIL